MEHQEGSFLNHRGQSIYYQSWLPESQPQGILLILHGLHEHSGRYQHLASFFTEHGYAVYGLDFPGHGKSEGTRSFINSFDDITRTVFCYLEMIQGWQPETPVYVAGHSMGGLVSAIFLLEHQQHIQGAILSGSLVQVPDYITDFTISLGRLLGAVFPKLRILGIDAEGLSRDPEVVQAYLDDPLVFNGKTTARLSSEINAAISRLAEEGKAISIPVLLLHGSDDRVCDLDCSKYLYDLVSSRDKELIIYEGFYHEVYNEPDARDVFEDVLEWLKKTSSGSLQRG